MPTSAICTYPSQETQMPEEIPFMNEAQFRRAKKLVRSLCANLYDGNCVLLDNEYATCVCPQLISYSLICKWFRSAVLPADQELYAEIMEADKRRHCGDCLQPFVPERKNNLYCKSCMVRRKRKRQREWVREKRGKMSTK